MSTVAMGFPLDLLLALQLFHPLLFFCDLLRCVPSLGLTALAQCRRTISKTFTVNARRSLTQPRCQILRVLRRLRCIPLRRIDTLFLFTALPRLPCVTQPRGKVGFFLSAVTPPGKRQLGLRSLRGP